jgi:hypothetical protein
MATAFLFCAIVGSTILVCQFVLTLLGLGGDHFDVGDHGGHDVGHGLGHDAGHDVASEQQQHFSTWLFGVITFRTLVAAIAFLGLGGMAAQAADLQLVNQLLIALACAVGAMYLVHWIMSTLFCLGEDHTVRIDRAVGREGLVYVPIPGGKAGPGKIQLQMQGRIMEYEAVTPAAEGLRTGARVVVVGVVGVGTLEVTLAAESAIVPEEA